MIYLDNAATTPLSQKALETLLSVSQEVFGNPSSIHAFGRKANQFLRQARQDIAQVLKVHPDHLIFTSGGSEADNQVQKRIEIAVDLSFRKLVRPSFSAVNIDRVQQFIVGCIRRQFPKHQSAELFFSYIIAFGFQRSLVGAGH